MREQSGEMSYTIAVVLVCTLALIANKNFFFGENDNMLKTTIGSEYVSCPTVDPYKDSQAIPNGQEGYYVIDIDSTLSLDYSVYSLLPVDYNHLDENVVIKITLPRNYAPLNGKLFLSYKSE